MYYLDAGGKRVFTLKKEGPDGKPTQSAHPARFSPDDKFSKHRLICKRRFGLLPTQQPAAGLLPSQVVSEMGLSVCSWAGLIVGQE